MTLFAAMDIGTNSVRLAVVEVGTELNWTTLASQKQVVRLGEGEFAGSHGPRHIEDVEKNRHRLTHDAIQRGALVCARFAEVARGFGATEITALATAAVREADNQDEFVDAVREAADIDVRVISGQEEARLIHLGVSSGIEIPAGERALFIDIGGGSTELIVGDSETYAFLDSLRMGAIRLTSEFIVDPSRPISISVWTAMVQHIQSSLAPAARSIARAGFSAMYGSSGTIMNLAEIAASSGAGAVPTSFRNYELKLTDLQAVTKRLSALPVEQRRRVPGINPDRADIIIAGAAILQTTMETVGAASVRISGRGLREGIVVDRILRGAGADQDMVRAHFAAVGARRRSIYKLMRATGVDDAHANHILSLSLQLFEQWKTLGLHDYGRARELLEYAALLHDCGFFVSHTDHQLHSYYLIRHSELLGFDDREVEIIANLALYHRKALPRRKHESFGSLDHKTQRVVKILSCALRLAEALDRGHLMLVTGVTCEKQSRPNRMAMHVHASSDAQLEIWAAVAQSVAFERTFGMPLEVKLARNEAAKRVIVA